MRPVLDALAQHVDGPAPGDLPLQSGQEPAPRWAVLSEVQRFGRVGLGIVEEGGELGEVHAMLTIIVLRVAAYPAGAVVGWPLARQARLRRLVGLARERGDNKAFETPFVGVGCRGNLPPHVLLPRPVEHAPNGIRPIEGLRDVCRIDLVVG